MLCKPCVSFTVNMRWLGSLVERDLDDVLANHGWRIGSARISNGVQRRVNRPDDSDCSTGGATDLEHPGTAHLTISHCRDYRWITRDAPDIAQRVDSM